jgi:hypothetical protein
LALGCDFHHITSGWVHDFRVCHVGMPLGFAAVEMQLAEMMADTPSVQCFTQEAQQTGEWVMRRYPIVFRARKDAGAAKAGRTNEARKGAKMELDSDRTDPC